MVSKYDNKELESTRILWGSAISSRLLGSCPIERHERFHNSSMF